jgi:hypothetical protein
MFAGRHQILVPDIIARKAPYRLPGTQRLVGASSLLKAKA